MRLDGLIAGLGVGGVILTLAAQDTAKNLFAGLTVFLDKPFCKCDRTNYNKSFICNIHYFICYIKWFL